MASEQDEIEQFLRTPGEQSFASLFRAVTPRLISFFRVRGCNVELAEDLVQEVMLAVYKGSSMLRNKELFRPWLYKIANNELLRHFRKLGRQVTTVDLAALRDLAGPPADPLLGSHMAELLEWLNEDERQIMALRYLDDLEHHEIAEILGMPLGTVQWKIFRSKKKLTEHFAMERTGL